MDMAHRVAVPEKSPLIRPFGPPSPLWVEGFTGRPVGIRGKAPHTKNGREGNAIKLRKTCHSEAVTDVTAVGIRI